MTNQLVGSVYQRIMDDVIENCQTTFEEDGVNPQILDDLRKTWQTKLTALKVGNFPWEPPPAPQPMPNPQTVPSNVPRPQQVPSSGPPTSTTPVPSNAAGGVRIKTEPGYEQPSYPPNGLPQNYGGPGVAAQRAAAHLQDKFGAVAGPQINQLHARAAMGAPGGVPSSQPQRGPMNIQLPPQMTDQQRQDQAEYKRRQQAQQYQNLQQAQQRPLVNNAQTDGADEWDNYVTQRRLDATKTPGAIDEADLTIRQQVELMNQSMEGGGLMLPRSEQSKIPSVKKRKVSTEAASSNGYSSLVAAQTSGNNQMPKIAQYDGANDDEDDEDDKTGIKDELFDDDDDEDAINSDLDDPDDNVIEEEQEEGRPTQIMLCTYDKVARVKNKWKCTLKDGVLTTGGKEYVFHRAQGEFEW